MARIKKVFNESEDVVTETAEQISIEPKTAKEKPLPTIIPKDRSVMIRKAPTMELKHIVGSLVPDFTYTVIKKVHSAIYGDFYLLNNGNYISTIGNFTMKE